MLQSVVTAVVWQSKETALHSAAKFGQLSAAVHLVEEADVQIDAQNNVKLLQRRWDCV